MQRSQTSKKKSLSAPDSQPVYATHQHNGNLNVGLQDRIFQVSEQGQSLVKEGKHQHLRRTNIQMEAA